MRIIGGRLKRRQLAAPKGRLTRPTTDRVREAIFNILASRSILSDAKVLDLFAGTGALGLEALSRGAQAAVFVESNPRVLAFARRNAEHLEVQNECTFIQSPVERYLGKVSGASYDLVFADPPYELASLPELPGRIMELLSPGGYLVLEHDLRHAFDDHQGLILTRPYGQTIVSLFSPVPGEIDQTEDSTIS